MRPCVRYLRASANLIAARPEDVRWLTTRDILKCGLYWARATGGLATAPASTEKNSRRLMGTAYSSLFTYRLARRPYLRKLCERLNRQRIVESWRVVTVVGLPIFKTGTSTTTAVSVVVSWCRAIRPTTTSMMALISATLAILKWVRRSAPISEWVMGTAFLAVN